MVGDIGGEHEDGNGSDGEAECLGEVGLVDVVGMLVVVEVVEIDGKDEEADDGADGYQDEVDITHR